MENDESMPEVETNLENNTPLNKSVTNSTKKKSSRNLDEKKKEMRKLTQ